MLYGKGQKASMEISMYPVTLRLIQKFLTERVHGNFHVSYNIEINSKMFLPKGSMEISMYPATLRIIQKCFYLKATWKFPCIL